MLPGSKVEIGYRSTQGRSTPYGLQAPAFRTLGCLGRGQAISGYVRADSKTTRMTSQVRRRSEIEKAKNLASIRGWTPVLPRKEATDDFQALRLAFRPTTSQS